MIVMPTATEQQAAATASDQTHLCFAASLGGCYQITGCSGQQTISLNTAHVHIFGFCNDFVSCCQTEVFDCLTGRELPYLVSIHGCTQTLRCMADAVGICHDLN